MSFPTTPVILDKVKYYDYKDAYLYLSSFVEGNAPVLFIGNEEKEVVYAICNLNPPFKLHDFEFAIKTYSENEGMLEWLVANNYMELPHYHYVSGFVKVPVCFATTYLLDKICTICDLEGKDNGRFKI